MRVLIISEDPTLDQHILKPVIAKIFDDLGRTARVEVLTDPHLGSASEALDPKKVREIVDDNRMTDIFILAVDRDCDRTGHSTKVATRENEQAGKVIGVLAWQEVEVWALALFRGGLSDSWAAIRGHCDPKEAYWDPFVKAKGWLGEVGKGRKKAMRNLGLEWSGLLQVCPEIAELRDRIRTHLEARP